MRKNCLQVDESQKSIAKTTLKKKKIHVRDLPSFLFESTYSWFKPRLNTDKTSIVWKRPQKSQESFTDWGKGGSRQDKEQKKDGEKGESERRGLNWWRDGCSDKWINESSVDTVSECEETAREGETEQVSPRINEWRSVANTFPNDRGREMETEGIRRINERTDSRAVFPLSSEQKGGGGRGERSRRRRKRRRLARAARVESIFNFQLDFQVNFFCGR